MEIHLPYLLLKEIQVLNQFQILLVVTVVLVEAVEQFKQVNNILQVVQMMLMVVMVVMEEDFLMLLELQVKAPVHFIILLEVEQVLRDLVLQQMQLVD